MKKSVAFFLAVMISCVVVVGCDDKPVSSSSNDVSNKNVSGENDTRAISLDEMKKLFESIKLGENRESVIKKTGKPSKTNELDESNANAYIEDAYSFEDYKNSFVFLYEEGVLVDKEEVEE